MQPAKIHYGGPRPPSMRMLVIGAIIVALVGGVIAQLTSAPSSQVAFAATPTIAPTVTSMPTATAIPTNTAVPPTATAVPPTATVDPATRIVFGNNPTITVTKDAVSASVSVRNTDTVTHAFNAQAVFYSVTVANLPADPNDALITAGFQAVILKAGESRTVTVHAKDFTNPHVLGVTFRATEVQ